jgi:uncharacterized membrane protein YhiD involved in acid resistance
MTAAIGVAVGLGALGIALLSTLFTIIILALVWRFELREAKEKAVIIDGNTTE